MVNGEKSGGCIDPRCPVFCMASISRRLIHNVETKATKTVMKILILLINEGDGCDGRSNYC